MVIIAGAVSLVLVVFASGYGYHRDELYFIAAGTTSTGRMPTRARSPR